MSRHDYIHYCVVQGIDPGAKPSRHVFPTTFTAEEDAYIREHYLTMPIKALARSLGRSACGVKGRMKHMGLAVPKDIAQKHYNMGMYRKGQPAWNKGKKCPWVKDSKAAATWFQKGGLPHNTKQDGAITYRLDKRSGIAYAYIRIAKSKWVHLHRYLWEQAHGPIPKDKIVVFRDGNSLNLSLGNLELIKRREHVLRNRYGPNYEEALAVRKNIQIIHSKIKKLTDEKQTQRPQ